MFSRLWVGVKLLSLIIHKFKVLLTSNVSSLVMQEYEQTISQLVAEKEQMKKSFEVQKDLIMNERDTAMQHLNNMEIAFNDVHQ